MRILTLWQPWATLCAIDEKAIETRGWGTTYRGPIAIHAAARFPAEARALCEWEPFRSVIAAHGLEAATLPLGVIVSVTKLVDCIPTDSLEVVRAILAGSRHERLFGNYAPGRKAWIFRRPPIRIEPPIPFKNGQGLRSMTGAIAGELAQRLLATGAPSP